VKIGPVDTEIALLIVKKNKEKKDINASKIYSPSVKFAERAKLRTLTFLIYFHQYRYRRMCNNRNAMHDSGFQPSFRNNI